MQALQYKHKRPMSKNKVIVALITLLSFAQLLPAQKSIHLDLNPAGANDSTKVTRGSAEIFLPKASAANGKAVIICPGGDYKQVQIKEEGLEWAPFFNEMGLAAIVLHYSLPEGDRNRPMRDLEELMRIVRKNAKAWHIKPDRIGVAGFGSGGHLAALYATKAPRKEKPAFQILFYPQTTMELGHACKRSRENLLGTHPTRGDEREYSPEAQVTRLTPRAWIAICDDDEDILPANGVNYYLNLYRNGISSSLHVYPDGGSGWGRSKRFKYRVEMEMSLRTWLVSF